MGIANKKGIPMEVILDSGEVSNDVSTVLNKWKTSYENLHGKNVNQILVQNDVNSCDDKDVCNVFVAEPLFNEAISVFEVRKVVLDAKRNKACGFDSIPVDVLKNDTSISVLHILFNVCFSTGYIPTSWGKGIINPIPKCSTTDPRDPLSYRGLTLGSSMYKLYCAVLNNRLTKWTEENNIVAEEQNGFRKNRNTLDHLSTLTTIIETRMKKQLSTFCAYIDFKKAYDCINRNILWKKLALIGVHKNSRMFTALKSLYSCVQSCVRLNSFTSEWFEVNTGLRQGCSLSPILFNLYINDFVSTVKELGYGVDIGNNEKCCILLYADDIVLLAECEQDLQRMLDILHDWCDQNGMTISPTKSQVVHYRPKSVNRIMFTFKCGHTELKIVEKYVYLGLVLTEFLDYNVMAKTVSQAASRALGVIIAKFNNAGGLPLNVYMKLYDSIVWPVIAYGSAIWGTRSFSCIDAVQHRAIRFFLGVGKYTPTAALNGDLGWIPPFVRQWQSVCNLWSRFSKLQNSRLNKQVFLYVFRNAGGNCRNFAYRVKTHLNKIECLQFFDLSQPIIQSVMKSSVKDKMMSIF